MAYKSSTELVDSFVQEPEVPEQLLAPLDERYSEFNAFFLKLPSVRLSSISNAMEFFQCLPSGASRMFYLTHLVWSSRAVALDLIDKVVFRRHLDTCFYNMEKFGLQVHLAWTSEKQLDNWYPRSADAIRRFASVILNMFVSAARPSLAALLPNLPMKFQMRFNFNAEDALASLDRVEFPTMESLSDHFVNQNVYDQLYNGSNGLVDCALCSYKFVCEIMPRVLVEYLSLFKFKRASTVALIMLAFLYNAAAASGEAADEKAYYMYRALALLCDFLRACRNIELLGNGGRPFYVNVELQRIEYFEPGSSEMAGTLQIFQSARLYETLPAPNNWQELQKTTAAALNKQKSD